jgi:hypothetical protein
MGGVDDEALAQRRERPNDIDRVDTKPRRPLAEDGSVDGD